MTPLYPTVAIVGRAGAPTLPTILPKIAALVRASGARIICDPRTAQETDWTPDGVFPEDTLHQHAQLAIAAGGDGTLLSLARCMVEADVPLVGVNLGRLGFLTDIGAGEIDEVLPALLAGDHIVEPRSLLQTDLLTREGELHTSLAMNDVVIARGTEAAMIEFSVSVDGEFVYSLRADGLILSTPTGSTAYALSAGGPILHPKLAAMALVPIAPHSLSNRPVVIPSQSRVEVAIVRGAARANFDVHSSWDLKPGDRVTTAVFPRPLRLLHPTSYSYYAMLRTKLHWNERPA
jgi:NAD+ kinase